MQHSVNNSRTPLSSFTCEIKHVEFAPISSLLNGVKEPNFERLQFCYQAVQNALIELLRKNYSSFDAQTTSNCCHGISLLVRELIEGCADKECEEYLDLISKKVLNRDLIENLELPRRILELTELYILTYVRTVCPQKGVRTSAKKLKALAPLGKDLFKSLVKTLQKKYSNIAALKYQEYFYKMDPEMSISGAPLKAWAKYVQDPYLRKSSQDILFAPCLYSMQLSLAYLIYTKAKIAIVNSIYGKNGLVQDVRVLVGNGVDRFIPISDLGNFSDDEFIVVFGGCAYNDDVEFVSSEMDRWVYHFERLILASDTFYPHFPKSCNDPEFGSAPLVPDEQSLVELISHYHQVKGISAEDPSFYCLNHIYPLSIKQLERGDFLMLKIPEKLHTNSPEFSK